ncbi:MAG TPA: HAD family hydrolase [Candidatus Limnocylindria bacterium]|nr:HAD family hydrolase [Candidatus Limnocylindria bacterium]
MAIRAAFFDVGDTLVEHWAPRDQLRELLREALRREFGERHWYEDFLRAEVAPAVPAVSAVGELDPGEEEALRQETLRWYEDWFRNAAIGVDDIEMDRLRVAMTVPLDLVSTPVPGAFTAVRWCKQQGLTVGLITNTLSRGDDEVREDWRRLGLADAIDHVVSSHSAGWQKPHRKIFERALALAGVAAGDAFMVGDRLDADIWGASRMGMRTVLRRTEHTQPHVDVHPDAAVDDLTELPGVVEPWLGMRRSK